MRSHQAVISWSNNISLRPFLKKFFLESPAWNMPFELFLKCAYQAPHRPPCWGVKPKSSEEIFHIAQKKDSFVGHCICHPLLSHGEDMFLSTDVAHCAQRPRQLRMIIYVKWQHFSDFLKKIYKVYGGEPSTVTFPQ